MQQDRRTAAANPTLRRASWPHLIQRFESELSLSVYICPSLPLSQTERARASLTLACPVTGVPDTVSMSACRCQRQQCWHGPRSTTGAPRRPAPRSVALATPTCFNVLVRTLCIFISLSLPHSGRARASLTLALTLLLTHSRSQSLTHALSHAKGHERGSWQGLQFWGVRLRRRHLIFWKETHSTCIYSTTACTALSVYRVVQGYLAHKKPLPPRTLQ